jgi:hypothetical protein
VPEADRQDVGVEHLPLEGLQHGVVRIVHREQDAVSADRLPAQVVVAALIDILSVAT